jgi:pyruvate kinase
MLAGMDMARLNFSHGTHEYHQQLYDTVRSVSEEVGKPVPILQDLQGPKIRIGEIENEPVQLEEGETFSITTEKQIKGTAKKASTTYEKLPDDVTVGDILLLDDGLIRVEVTGVKGGVIETVVQVGGPLKSNKGINCPTTAITAPSLTEKDIEDLKFGMELGVDYVALSFVRSALDIHQLRAVMPDELGDRIPAIAKVEMPEAIEELDDIISVGDGIMIARGDLGVELPPQKVPMIQKRAIRRANEVGRISITATQMLESMTEHPRPTRAEASDVANAVLDGTDAVMLSGETAAGKYPVESVEMMANIIEEVEDNPDSPATSQSPKFIKELNTFPNATAKSAVVAADELDVEAIVVLTQSGATARLLMTYRPSKPILACTPDRKVYHQMGLFWGVESFQMDIPETTETMLERVETFMREQREAASGDEIVLVMSSPVDAETNLIKFHRL